MTLPKVALRSECHDPANSSLPRLALHHIRTTASGIKQPRTTNAHRGLIKEPIKPTADGTWVQNLTSSRSAGECRLAYIPLALDPSEGAIRKNTLYLHEQRSFKVYFPKRARSKFTCAGDRGDVFRSTLFRRRIYCSTENLRTDDRCYRCHTQHTCDEPDANDGSLASATRSPWLCV